MELIINKLDEFSKAYPNCRSFLQSIVEKEKDKMNLVRDETVKMFEKAKELCEYDVANFKKSVLPGFKYKLELLKNNDPDYELLKDSIGFNDNSTTMNARLRFELKQKTKALKIYRIVPNETFSIKSSNSDQILLLHGTKAQNVEGILKTGFDPSQKGSHGPGVYLTNSFSYAYDYSDSFASEENTIKHLRYFFVNSIPNPVLCSQDNQFRNMSFDDYLTLEPSVKIYKNESKQLVEVEKSTLDMFDSQNRKISEGSLQNHDQLKIALAHHNFVEPAYLIEIEEKSSVDDVVNGTLYNCLKMIEYDKISGLFYKDKRTIKESSFKRNKSEFSFAMIEEYFKNEIIRNHQAEVQYLTMNFENRAYKIMKQLSVQLSSILKDDKKRKCSIELLKKENDDYKFILSSFEKRDVGKWQKVKELFKIHDNDKEDDLRFKQKYLYLKGVQADNVKDILVNGYPRTLNGLDESDSSLFQPTTNIHRAIYQGSNFCEVDNKVKQLSFVFVVCSKAKYKEFNCKDMKMIEDSRKSLTRKGLFSDNEYGTVKTHLDLFPAYLIVFESDKTLSKK